jgi:sugar lactone lactonase YvrE
VETLVTGHSLVEGPRYGPDGSVWFSDVMGGGIHRLAPDGKRTKLAADRRGIGGLLPRRDGGMVASGRTVCRVTEDGDVQDLLAVEGVTGFNDLATDGTGRVLAGALRYRPLKGEDPVPGEVWRIEPDGAAAPVLRDVTWSNGIGLAPGGDVIYVSDYANGQVLAFDPDGGDRRVFAESPRGSADGLAVDREGGVWLALGAGAGIARFEPDGALREVIEVDTPFVSSLCFGGQDLMDLYVSTGDGRLLRGRAEVPGLPVPLAAI